jgi:poly-gamma-glutamate biosynthesis protein PgsC/CapC
MSHLFVSHSFDIEMVRLAIFLSALASLLVYQRFGLASGGTIAAGYLALFVPQPSHIVITLVIVVLTYLIVHKILRPRLMLWGRRLFVTEMVVALVLNSLWFVVLVGLTPTSPEAVYFYTVGFLLPGIMTHDMGRQGVVKTLRVTLLCTLAIFGLLWFASQLRTLLGYSAGQPLTGTDTSLAYPAEWLLIAINLSVIANIVLYHWGGGENNEKETAIRTGGFVTAAYLALLITRPIDLLVIALCSILTYLIVVHGFMRWFIVFGRMKLSAMFLTAFVVTTLVEGTIMLFAPTLISFSIFNAIIPTIVALLANDAQRQGAVRTLIGSSLSTAGVAVIMFGLTALVGA